MATKQKYFRVRKDEEKEDKPETDIIMRFNDTYGRYVARALNLFFGQDKSFVTIKAAEKLSSKALWVAEVVKRKVKGLHQIISINERQIVDIYEPKEQGLKRVQQKRYLTILEVTLTKTPTEGEKKQPGYQPPIQMDNEEFLTKDKWQKEEKERQQRVEKRKSKPFNERNDRQRGQQKRRGTNWRR